MTSVNCPICEIVELGPKCPICNGTSLFFGTFYKYTSKHNISDSWKSKQDTTYTPYLIKVSGQGDKELGKLTHEFSLLCTGVTPHSFQVESLDDIDFPWTCIPRTFLSKVDESCLDLYDVFSAYVAYEGVFRTILDKNKASVIREHLGSDTTENPRETGGTHIKSISNELPPIRYITNSTLSGDGTATIHLLRVSTQKRGLARVMGSKVMESVDKMDVDIINRFTNTNISAYVQTGCLEGNGGIFGGEGSFYGEINPMSLAVRTTCSSIHVINKPGTSKKKVSDLPQQRGKSSSEYDDTDSDYYCGWGRYSQYPHPDACAYQGGSGWGSSHTIRSRRAYSFGTALNSTRKSKSLHPLDLFSNEEKDGENNE